MYLVRFTFLYLFLILFVACSNHSGDSVPIVETKLNEFSAFHPETGLPLTEEDIVQEILREQRAGQSEGEGESGGGENNPLVINDPGFDLKKEKDNILLGWHPEGEYNSNISPQCHYSEVEKMISNWRGPTSELAKVMQTWSDRCNQELSRFRTSSLLTVLRFDAVKYELTNSLNSTKKLEFELNDGTKVNGILSLKEGRKPLVIYRSGIYTDAIDGGVLRNFYMQLFEESPFHVLFLASVTGEEFTRTNRALAVGGFDEGMQNLKIAEMLAEDERYKDLIEDIHIVGVSLGSNSVLFSSLYSSMLPPSSPIKIKSAVALCPVVNLEPTLKSVFKVSVRGIFYSILTSQFLSTVYKDVPILKEVLPKSLIWTQKQMYDAITEGVTRYYKEKTNENNWGMAPFKGRKVSSLDDVWDLNNFIKYADQVTTPTLVIHAKDDFLVDPSFNTEDLLSKTRNENTEVGVFEFENGSHCGFNVANGWATISSLLRTFILKNSSYKVPSLEQNIFSLPFSKTLKSTQKITKYTFSGIKDKEYVETRIDYFDSSVQVGLRKCSSYDSLSAPSGCYGTAAERVNLDAFSALNLKLPKSSFEARRLSRWFNTHSFLLNSNSEQVLGRSDWPRQIRFISKPDF